MNRNITFITAKKLDLVYAVFSLQGGLSVEGTHLHYMANRRQIACYSDKARHERGTRATPLPLPPPAITDMTQTR